MAHPMPLNRRELLVLLSGSTFLLDIRAPLAQATTRAASLPLDFPQGVASGDPGPTSVMLWTRALPRGGEARAAVLLEVAATDDFAAPLLQRLLAVEDAHDFTLRAYVEGLEPDRRYFYRFVGADGTGSRTGRTRTAPAPGQAREARLAFVSCQNYEQGFYGAWARLLADDEAAAPQDQIDFVLHLGDFIYERSWHRRQDGTPLSRTLPPFPDGAQTEHNRHAVSLADYRHLYRTYLADPWLQEARARWPFICTWDDHEFSDDCFQSYSNYQPAPLLEPRRRYAANQAWLEYIPCVLDELVGQPAHGLRPANFSGEAAGDNRRAQGSLSIYRRLNWGAHLDILLTDARSYRSPPCLERDFAASLGLPMNTVELVAIADAGRDYRGGHPPATLPCGDGTTPNPARDRAPGTCLGEAQRDWFLDTLRHSRATWKLWGNSIPLLPLRLDMSSVPLAGYQDSVFNIDAWQGYPGEASYLLEQVQAAGITGLVSLSGDHHMHGAGAIAARFDDPQAAPVTVDFSCAGISSSSLFDNVRAIAGEEHPEFAALVEVEENGQVQANWNMTLLQGVLAAYAYHRTGSLGAARWLGPNAANPGLAFVDSTANGYGLAHFASGGLAVELVAVSRVQADFSAPPQAAYRARFELPLWQPDDAPQLHGPRFLGEPPFPFTAASG